ncbi:MULTISPECIES: non-ribosomal peptide synthetase [Nostocales]|uniref:Amino acid adenylation domain-containing protein n=3 Tax=Nostocales TaxID=1161 RepID=A0A0C1RED9_9CYAN|nr:non-ribosomal peptide synthetase [Tolypothrix bouteillei]KAF3886562.1 amino acid adenylation domain-containing protein [Tolypothrix bouteillei VB521301]
MDNINQKIAALSPEKRALLELKLKKNKMSDAKTQQTIPRRTNTSSAPLSFAQQRLWFLEQLEPDCSLYHIPHALKLQGNLNVNILQQSLDAIVNHHEVLRTNFIARDGEPIQVVGEPRSVELEVIDLKDCPSSDKPGTACAKGDRATIVQRLVQERMQRPFNLISDLMLRGCLLQLSPQEHILLLIMHHIATDGWSMSIFCEQLTALYQAFINGKSNPLPKLPIQYADYAVWQRQWLSGEVLENQLNYWKQQLTGATPVLELPTDRPRPAVQTYRGAKQFFVLPDKLSQALSALSRLEGVTLFMTLLAAFQTLLYRYSGQEDILVGSPIAGRNRTEIEGLIGFFVNTLVLRTDMSGHPSFQKLLRRVRSVAMSAYVNQDLPFEKLVEELQPERSLSYNPLFQVMFALHNMPKQTLELPGLTISSIEVDNIISKFDLTLFVQETEQGLQGVWEYNTDLFDAATITRMSGHFQTLLQSIVDNPQQNIDKLSMLASAEQHQLLYEWNDTRANYPQQCIHELFELQVERNPDAIAVEFKDEQLTYRELNNRANQLAHYLRALGVEPDVLVGICMQRSSEMIVGLLGILKAGGAYVPLDPAYPQERLTYMLSDSKVPVLLTTSELVAALPESKAHIVCLDTDWKVITQESHQNPVSTVQINNLAYINYTSGSTGTPKGVKVLHRGAIRLLFGVNYVRLDATRKFLHMAPISFDASTFEIWGALLHGACCVLFSENIPTTQELSNAIHKYGITTLWLTSALFNSIIDDDPLALSGIQQLLTGGEALSVPHVQKALESLPSTEIINGYGPTESTTFTCCYSIPRQLDKTVQSISIGRPISNTQVYLLNTQLQPTPIGVPGELYIGGAGLAQGYLNRPELTAEKFISNPFNQQDEERLYKTGDLARYLPDGNIEFLGRIDNQVKLRGFRIELGEIETVLSQHPSVLQNAVILREDIRGDKRLVAYVVPNPETALTVNELRHFLQEKLPKYMVPASFVMLEALPLSPNGKVNRRALPAPEQVRQESETTFVAPCDELEHQLAQIWEEILGVKPVGIKDNFFELGGHSLLAVHLFAQIEQKLGKKLPLATLFQSGTVEALAQMLREQEKAMSHQVLTTAPAKDKSVALWSSLVAIQPKGSKPPFFCIHPAGGETLCFRSLALHLGLDQPFYGLQPRGLDGKQPPLTRIEDMAALYIQEIQTIQPNGPYFLGGYSIGGVIAYEMVLQLQRQGYKVNLLVIFDSGLPNSVNQRLPFHQRSLIHLGNFIRRGPSYLRKKLVGWSEWGNYQIRERYTQLLGISKPLPEDDKHINIIDANLQALKAYTMPTYSGQITLFRTDENSDDSQDHAVGMKPEPLLGWDKVVTGGIDVHYVPGSHTTLFEEPNVRDLADKLKNCLEKGYLTSCTYTLEE